MPDFLMAIWADRNTCKPYTGPGRVGHVVRVTDNPHPTVINEFVDGGSFEHADCAPASFQSWLLDRTSTRTTIREIERLAGTTAYGTGWKGIEVAGLHFGYQIHFVPNDPITGFVMNPGGGYVDPPADFPAYLAATQGGCLVLPNVGAPLPKPIPTPPTKPEDDMPKLGQFIAKTTTGGLAYFISDGMHFRHVLNPTDEAGVSATGPWFNGDGQPLRLWNPQPVADIAAFGVPANKETADLLGLTFP